MGDETKTRPIVSQNSTATSKTPVVLSSNFEEIETRVDIIVKHPEVILLEDQHNANSNCLVLDVRFSSF